MERRREGRFCDHYVVRLPKGHRFPMEKYRLLREALVEQGLVCSVEILAPEPATDEQILRAHHNVYLKKVKAGALTKREVRRLGFAWSPELVRRARDARWEGRSPRVEPRLTKGLG